MLFWSADKRSSNRPKYRHPAWPDSNRGFHESAIGWWLVGEYLKKMCNNYTCIYCKRSDRVLSYEHANTNISPKRRIFALGTKMPFRKFLHGRAFCNVHFAYRPWIKFRDSIKYGSIGQRPRELSFLTSWRKSGSSNANCIRTWLIRQTWHQCAPVFLDQNFRSTLTTQAQNIWHNILKMRHS